ncbi:MAG: NAD(P)/FAD-dependent oxidoreductase [Gammaproteobacteria bacterium]|nr:NAD(P)/FAD-dependent oxidoreductase [Gammaproteobacteria bacterium]
MSEATVLHPESDAPEHFDVLIVGAGISGVGGAVHLKTKLPGKSFAILENQDSFGGTWKTHTYPGIRSDSDLYTFGYRFKPWTGAPIASAEAILDYMGEVIEEYDIDPHIRYGHTVLSASWSDDAGLWTLVARRNDTGEETAFTCRFLWMCQGYYRHSQGYTPEWPGMDRYQGTVVHPQTWPEDLDYEDKTVLVIGSGATAATLIPAMADKTRHITMLQRSPTYFAPGENRNELADSLREIDVPEEWVHEIVRRRILHDMKEVTRRSFEEPEGLKEELLAGARAYLGDDFDIDAHFTPSYRPWQQRLAFIPEGDLFRGIAEGKASVVTDEIETFNETGVRTKSGKQLDADIIITATGFNLCMFGDIEFDVDGKPVDFADTVTWRGMMFTGVPNMCWVFGYLRTSWTMRADLISDFVCRLLGHMDDKGVDVVTPTLRSDEQDMERGPWVAADNFNAGYLVRGMHLLPKQGTHLPWRHTQDYYFDKDDIPNADLDDGTLVYDVVRARARSSA